VNARHESIFFSVHHAPAPAPAGSICTLISASTRVRAEIRLSRGFGELLEDWGFRGPWWVRGYARACVHARNGGVSPHTTKLYMRGRRAPAARPRGVTSHVHFIEQVITRALHRGVIFARALHRASGQSRASSRDHFHARASSSKAINRACSSLSFRAATPRVRRCLA